MSFEARCTLYLNLCSGFELILSPLYWSDIHMSFIADHTDNTHLLFSYVFFRSLFIPFSGPLAVCLRSETHLYNLLLFISEWKAEKGMVSVGVHSVHHIVKDLKESFIRPLRLWWDEVGVNVWDMQVGRRGLEKQKYSKIEKVWGKDRRISQDFLSDPSFYKVIHNKDKSRTFH